MKRILSLTVALFICHTFIFVLPIDSASGQVPTIGIIDFYGLRSVSEQQAREALQIKEGGAVPESREEIERRLEALPNVLQARLTFVCCEAGKTIVYVGLKERGAPTLRFHSAPHGTAKLPDNMLQAEDALSNAVTRAVEKGDVAEDDSQGHALFHNPEARAVQERFITFAAHDLKLLHSVLRDSSDARHRALAAEIMAYAANKLDVVKDLVYGMSDPDEGVRNNSMRALAIIARYARSLPNQRIKVPALPFIEMLNSIVWTDRNKASAVLLQLTEGRDAAILSSLRQRALQSLVEMSRWKSQGHASAPFFIMGRVGNLSDAEIQRAWDSGNRQSLIETVLKRVWQR
jgi:hypothetical protein